MLSATKTTAISDDYCVRLLSPEDEVSVQNLCERCADFSMLIEGRLPEKSAGHDILFDLPPNKDLEDKYVIGVYKKESSPLIAVIDLIKDYKNPGEWTMGLMMIDPDERGQRLGRTLQEFVKTLVLEHRGKVLRIGVVEENSRAYKFWREMGYAEVDRVSMTFGNKTHRVIVMNLPLT